MNKVLEIALWGVMVLALIIFVAVIATGHSTSFRFLSNINLTDVQLLAETKIPYTLKG